MHVGASYDGTNICMLIWSNSISDCPLVQYR